jgi:O-acetyl-ADP-ribose deacetylase (regulator of RNase III)
MIKTKNRNVLDIPEGIIVHGCNSHGVMGSGIALEIKNRFPEVFAEYRRVYEEQGNVLHLGQIIPVQVADKKWIINAITQKDYGRVNKNRYASYDAIATVFENVNEFAIGRGGVFDQHDDTWNVCFPKIGAGLAQGNWNIISSIIDESLHDSIQKTLYIFTP